MMTQRVSHTEHKASIARLPLYLRCICLQPDAIANFCCFLRSPSLSERAFLRAHVLLDRLSAKLRVGDYCQVLIRGGRVQLGMLVRPTQRPAASADAFITQEQLDEIEQAI